MAARRARTRQPGEALRVDEAVSLISYPVCGALAGLVSAVVWFRFQERDEK